MEPLEIAEKLKKQFPDEVEEPVMFAGQVCVSVSRKSITRIAEFLQQDQELAFDYLADLCGCDYPDRDERFEIVYNLRSIKYNYLLRLKVELSEEEAEVNSVSGVWAAAEWFEREVYDMFGIVFLNHPDLRRLLMPDDWEGYPLKKDFPLEGHQHWQWPALEEVKLLHENDKLWQVDSKRPENKSV